MSTDFAALFPMQRVEEQREKVGGSVAHSCLHDMKKIPIMHLRKTNQPASRGRPSDP